MGIAALIISIIALVVAGASLGWQVRKHVLDGPRIEVSIGGATHWRGDTVVEENAQVVVRNQGRGPTFISHVMLRLPDDSGTMEIPEYQDWRDLNDRALAGHESVTIELGLAAVYEYLRKHGLNECQVVAECHLGSGRVVDSGELTVRPVPRVETFPGDSLPG